MKTLLVLAAAALPAAAAMSVSPKPVRVELLRDPAAVRAMSYKTLYRRARHDAAVRRQLLEAAKREPNKEARLAAIWALMYSGDDSEVRRGLLELAKGDPDAAVAREAARSLYAQVHNDPDVLRFARENAERGSGELRYVAIMMLAARRFDQDTRLLEQIAAHDADAQARKHALTALGGHSVDVIYFFHQDHYQWIGGQSRLVSEAIDRE